MNLRKATDPSYEGVHNIHAPAPDSVEVYDISQGRNKKWITKTLKTTLNPDLKTPIYIHCALGKDRTGVLVAALLSLLEIPENLILNDYLLSKGTLQPELIQQAISQLQNSHLYQELNISLIKNSFSLREFNI